MPKTPVQTTLNRLQAQINALKRFIRRTPDFQVDEANWQKVRPLVKKVRKENYRRTYAL